MFRKIVDLRIRWRGAWDCQSDLYLQPVARGGGGGQEFSIGELIVPYPTISEPSVTIDISGSASSRFRKGSGFSFVRDVAEAIGEAAASTLGDGGNEDNVYAMSVGSLCCGCAAEGRANVLQ